MVLLLTVLIAVPLSMRAEPAAASGHAVMPQTNEPGICLLTQDCSPPRLLNLNQSLYAATPAQVASLRKLEDQAIAAVIDDHGLSAGDNAAVLTWGRDQALAQLWTLLLDAIGASPRSADQQNAVDWLNGIVPRKSVSAAQAVGREYVKWAGLNEGAYWSLLSRNPGESELRAFLDDSPQPWNPPHYTAGWCAYRSPAPYSSEYTGYNDRTCLARCSNGVLPCSPPTPSYEQFVKWGEAVATYDLLKSDAFARAAQKQGLAATVGLAAAAPALLASGTIAYSAIVSQAATSATLSYLLPAAVPAAVTAALVGVIIVAVVAAVIEGIRVINASELPGQLAELIVNARTNAPDLKSMAATSDGAMTMFAMFVMATLPTPVDDTCDNSALPRGIVVLDGVLDFSGNPPCLNPSPIPPASPRDPQFLVRADGSPTTTRSATITWTDPAAGTTTTGRLHKNWFITETNGSAAQTLRITYKDWAGKVQTASLVERPANGHTFVSVRAPDDPSTKFEVATCLEKGLCTESTTLQYLGPAGEKLSAKVEPYAAPTGTPKYTSGDEGQALSFDANGFKPGLAEGAISYQWRFQNDGCGADPCRDFGGVPGGVPAYGTPVAGTIATHAWAHSGPFSVELTATDSVGRTGTTTFPVTVGNVPPTLDLVPDCPQEMTPIERATLVCQPRTGQPATPVRMSGSFDDVGVKSDLTVSIDWGDGSGVQWNCISGATFCGNGDPMDLHRSVDGQYYLVDVSHPYTAPGTYYGRVSVSDRAGGTASEAFVITIAGRPAAPGDLHGEIAPAAGLGSGQVKLAWSAPVSNGATITDYRIERSADRMVWSTVPDAVSTATTSTLEDMGIFPTWLRVSAVTPNWLGPPSDAIKVTPQYGPIAPMVLTAAVAPEPGVGSGQVKLSWGNPIIGENLTGYFVEWSVDGTTWTTVPLDATARSYTVDGLANFTPHRFRLLSRNPVGVSPPSEVQATPAGTPAAPAGLAATLAPAPGVNSGQVRLSWQAAPVAAGITDYVIESSVDGTTWTTVNDGVSTATTYTVSGLTNGTPYSFRVAAKNAYGLGSSSPAIPATPVWRPGPVVGLTGTVAPAAGVGSGQVKLSWTAPADNGSAITDYIIQSADRIVTGPFGDDVLNWTTINDGVSTATTHTVSGLTNGTGYWFRVFAKNAVGNGLALAEPSFIPRWVPNAPGGLTPSIAPAAGVGSGQVKLTWNAPANNGAGITDYFVESSVDGTTWTTVDDGVSTATTYTVGGLTNGTRYWIRVSAKNGVGLGPWSQVVEATPVAVPAAPGGLTAVAPITALGTQARLSWNAAADNGAPITDYVIQSSVDGTTWTTVNDGVSTATTYTVNGLINALRYSFRVAAKNAVGLGPSSPSVRPTLVLT